MINQLTLTNDTLRVLLSVVPTSPICGEVLRAKDYRTLGRLTTGDVRYIRRALDAAMNREPDRPLVRAAVQEAGDELRDALRAVDVDALDTLGYHDVHVLVSETVAAGEHR